MKLPMSIWLPALAALFIATIGGGLGVIFMILLSVGHESMPKSWDAPARSCSSSS